MTTCLKWLTALAEADTRIAAPLMLDDEGYLVAQSDFTEPVGPGFWSRPRD